MTGQQARIRYLRIAPRTANALLHSVKVHAEVLGGPVNNLEYFDFRQVASARALSKLLSSGVAPLRIRQSPRQVDTWWPGAAQTLSQLETLGHDGGIVLRLDDGAMADPSGQLMMAFDEPEGTGTPKTDPGGDALTGEAFGFGQAELRTTDEWLAVAAQFDATDRPALAIRAYQETGYL